MSMDKIAIRHTAIGRRIVLARFGKNPDVALETRDAMSEFWKALVSYTFDGKMPEPGQTVEVTFGGGNEQFVLTLKRKDGCHG